MKIKNIKNINGFINAINACEGKVILKNENIEINLKSQLITLLYLFTMMKEPEIEEAEIIFENPIDFTKFYKFIEESNI